MSGRFKAHKTRSEILEGRLGGVRVVLAKPRSYMNDSGGPVSGLLDFFKVPLERLVVVHDELDLPFGGLRLKLGGGDNGHNGLKSVRRSIGSGDFNRVRVGIGRPPGRQSPADYVLHDFASAERAVLPNLLSDAADAVEHIADQGLLAAQQKFHAPSV
jgi:PTH1 family peptidyl-tRNA hydrolase